MTLLIKEFVVTLADDVREDDARIRAEALRLLRGVVDVRPVGANQDEDV